jgi:DNA-binding NtrC family response regulator
VVVDCSAIPGQLLESELFGHERGAFTGALAARQGAFEEANGGTLLLDEIGEMSLDLQPKLLRVLEQRKIKRIGENHYRDIDVRVIAATNRNLRAEVNAGRFRSDLYYRLAVIRVHLPPLRKLLADIPLLAEGILLRLGGSEEVRRALTSTAFIANLDSHPWPGNVRELRNYLERCVAFGESVPFESEEQTAMAEGTNVIDATRPLREVREQCLRDVERRYLHAVLAKHDGNVTAAARTAGVDRSHFHRLLRKYRLGGD